MVVCFFFVQAAHEEDLKVSHKAAFESQAEAELSRNMCKDLQVRLDSNNTCM